MTISRAMALLLMAILLPGCTKTISHPVAAYHPGVAPTTQPVPRTAVYSIRFLDQSGKKFGGVPGSHRLLRAGDHVGFDINESGSLIAIAAGDKFPVDAPAGAGMVWSTTYRKPTQFSKEVAKAAKVTVKGAGLFTGAVIRGIIESGNDDDEDCYPARPNPYR